MNTTDQNGPPLTRKQLRELRLTGSTPVITEQPAEAEDPVEEVVVEPAVEEVVEPAEAVTVDTADESPTEAAEAAEAAEAGGHVPLTRREARAQERARTASVPVLNETDESADVVDTAPEQQPIVDSVPRHEVKDEPEQTASETVLPAQEAVLPEPVLPAPIAPEVVAPTREQKPADAQGQVDESGADESKAEAKPKRPMVGAAFGIGVKHRVKKDEVPTAFDELLDTDSTGSQKTANALIFTPSAGAGSLSGPIASTGELLITGTYNLPEGLGSRGHAHGTTDGKDIDAVLLDAELAPNSSPTPIAASSAVSTLKPAGEVIRPPAPEKGGKLTLTLAIVAGGLGLALAAVIAIAAFTGVFN